MVERTLFTTQVPAIVQDPDTGGVTLGVRWFSDQPGEIVAIRFYKGGTQGGNSHTVRLYSAAGGILATAVSSGETNSGWQRVNLATPVPIAANTEYRVAVFWPAGRYSATNNFFTSQFNNLPLHAYGSNNGVYTYAESMVFPTSTWQASNYFVDPIVEIETAPPPVGYKTIGRGTYPLREPQFIRPAAPPPPPPAGRVFYVATTGSDSNPGTQTQPWRNINTALGGPKNLQPGDTVIVMPGTYTETVNFSDGGNASGYVTLRSHTRHTALVRPTGAAYSTIRVLTNYVRIDGLDVVGGSGHAIDGATSPSLELHHIEVLNCVCHDSGGSGIAMAYGEFYRFEGNIIYGNCNTNGFQTSGLNIYQARNSSGDTTTGFRNIIRNNIAYDNIVLLSAPWNTDGNGIIIDDFQNLQNNSTAGIYPYETLVESNLCFNNGGKGIQVVWSDHITVRNNTFYHNNLDNNFQSGYGWRSEMSNAFSDHNTWVNNIAYCDPSINSDIVALADRDTAGGNVNVLWYNNLTFNGTTGQNSFVRDGSSNPSLTDNAPFNNIFGANPLFVDPGTAPTSNFRLQADLPANNVGTDAFGLSSTDLDGNPRVRGAAVDMGCYENE